MPAPLESAPRLPVRARLDRPEGDLPEGPPAQRQALPVACLPPARAKLPPQVARERSPRRVDFPARPPPVLHRHHLLSAASARSRHPFCPRRLWCLYWLRRRSWRRLFHRGAVLLLLPPPAGHPDRVNPEAQTSAPHRPAAYAAPPEPPQWDPHGSRDPGYAPPIRRER